MSVALRNILRLSICRGLSIPSRSLSNVASNFKIEGFCSPPVTPMTSPGKVNFDLTDWYIEHFQEFGIPNVFLLGTTGEHLNLSIAERRSIAEDWVSNNKGRLDKIIIHIGAGNIVETQELAKHAEVIGADAIACIGPNFFKPETFDTYLQYMSEVSNAAPTLPFILYDFQGMTGINYGVNDFFHAAQTKIPNLAGVKHTTPDFASIDNVLQDHPNTNLLLGTDDLYLPGLSLGVTGDIIQSYIGHVLNRMKQSFLDGDIESARVEQNRALKTCNIRRKYGVSIPGATKLILQAMGFEVGSPRLPLADIPQDMVKAVRKDLDSIGFFEWALKK